MKAPPPFLFFLDPSCEFYRGDRPCQPHIDHGATCKDCPHYVRKGDSLVLIKLGAAGDVIRTTPLLRALHVTYPGIRILFVTHYPELLDPASCEAVKPTPSTILRLQRISWNAVWNLDKDIEACLLAENCFRAPQQTRKGFVLKNDTVWYLPQSAHKYATGIDNDYSKANTLSYVHEIFEMVGMKYSREEYWVKPPLEASRFKARNLVSDGAVLLNTGAGGRWPTRIWPDTHWVKLIERLTANGISCVLAGGPEEVEKNERIMRVCSASLAVDGLLTYHGVQPIDVFYAMLAESKVVVTAVTQALHLAIAAKTPVVLLNNIFNRHEFELYDRGCVIEPVGGCDCYYAQSCRTGKVCVKNISVDEVFDAVLRMGQYGK